MKLKLKDTPKEWRKTTLLTVIGLVVIASLLRWRHHLSTQGWILALAILLGVIVVAVVQPRWFRGYHLFSMKLGFKFSRYLGLIVLTLFFFIVLTPLGLFLRLIGKDLLRLKRVPNATTYWVASKPSGPLDRMF